MNSSPDSLRRRVGSAFLVVALLMLVLGLTILSSHLGKGMGFVCYWLVCIAFTGLAFLNAALDLFIVRVRARRDQERLVNQALKGKNPEEQQD
jgi:hypothetical protein